MEEQNNLEQNNVTQEAELSSADAESKTSKMPAIAAIIVVLVIAIGAFYLLEKQGTVSTGVFGVQEQTIATVNGSEIDSTALQTSLAQISSAAELQGINVTDASVQADLQAQAIEMLVNTELLEQEALAQGVVVSDDDVENRIDQLVEQLGSENQLRERMALLGIDEDTLRSDVRSELTIQGLLEQVFEEKNISVTSEEIEEFFDVSIGPDSELTLDEVRPQIEAQLVAQKEQEVIDELLTSLRSDAEIIIN